MHTKEPWYVGTQNDVLYIINRAPRPAGGDMRDIPDVKVVATLNACNDEENARRLVACVNLCANIPTPDLEKANEGAGKTLTAYGQACKDRDTLLAVVERCYETFGANNHEWKGRSSMAGQSLLGKMRDAICDATGRDPQDVQDDFTNRYLGVQS